jgi:hypothetical protein
MDLVVKMVPGTSSEFHLDQEKNRANMGQNPDELAWSNPAGSPETCCPQGHKLSLYTTKAGGTCDGCGAAVAQAQVMDCRKCNWYLCAECTPQPANGGAEQANERKLKVENPFLEVDDDDDDEKLDAITDATASASISGISHALDLSGDSSSDSDSEDSAESDDDDGGIEPDITPRSVCFEHEVFTPSRRYRCVQETRSSSNWGSMSDQELHEGGGGSLVKNIVKGNQVVYISERRVLGDQSVWLRCEPQNDGTSEAPSGWIREEDWKGRVVMQANGRDVYYEVLKKTPATESWKPKSSKCATLRTGDIIAARETHVDEETGEMRVRCTAGWLSCNNVKKGKGTQILHALVWQHDTAYGED